MRNKTTRRRYLARLVTERPIGPVLLGILFVLMVILVVATFWILPILVALSLVNN